MAADSMTHAPLRGLPLAEQTLPRILQRQAARFAERPALATTSGETRTFEELRRRSAAWAGLLERIGIERGDRVAAIAGNRVELIELLLGCAWMGAVAVPLATTLRGTQLAQALRDSGARALIIETEHLDALARVPPPPTLERIWLLDRERPHRAHGYRCEPLPALGESAAAAAVSPGDPQVVLYSTATTGVARGVCCPHAQLYWWGVIGSEFLCIGPDDVCLSTLPLAHPDAIGSLYQALVAGAKYVWAPRFSPSRYWHLARTQGATRCHLLESMVSELLAQPPSGDDGAHGVRIALASGSVAGQREEYQSRFGVALLDGYHSVETSHLIGVPGEEPPSGSIGRAVDDFELAVLDEQDAPVADGEPGELAVRPRHPFSIAVGYYAMAAQTLAASRNLWFHTGTRVVRDSEGWFRIVESAPESISRYGEQVSLADVERTLLEHPSVAAATVFFVSPGYAKSELMAVIVPEPGADLDPLTLIDFCEQRIARFALPRYIDFAATLPVSDLGSVRKAELRERGVGPATWDRERTGEQIPR